MEEKLKKNASQASEFLKIFANPHRLVILCLLAEGEKNVSELLVGTGLAQTSITQHLKKLREDNIVSSARKHRSVIYKIKHPFVKKLMKLLYSEFCK